MSSTTPMLFRALVDDAAVFPPGNAPLPEAVASHAVHRTAWYAGCVGPLLVPVSSVAHLEEVLDARDAGTGREAAADVAAADIVLVARPGTDPAMVTAGLDALHAEPRVRVAGVELAWEEGWRDLGFDDVRLALEVPRGDDQAAAVTDVHRAVDEGRPVVAKFRTGPTPTWRWPDEAEVAAFIGRCTRLGVPFRLTGGLHHAVRGTYEVGGAPEENHGVLNVLLATAASLDGAGPAEVAGLLAVRDAEALAELVAAWPEATVTRVRAAFTAYGCCTVTDPVRELADLGLLARP